MNTLLIVATFLAFFMCYNTSKRIVDFKDFFLEKWSQNNRSNAKKIGISILVICFFTAVFNYGLAAGLLFQCIVLMTVASLIIGIGFCRINSFFFNILTFEIKKSIQCTNTTAILLL